MPLNGSSSSSTDGSWTRAAATRVRWRMPLLYVSILRSRRRSISTGVERLAGGGPGVGQPVQFGVGDDELAAGEEVVHRLALGTRPMWR
jgi:hypothetical protein